MKLTRREKQVLELLLTAKKGRDCAEQLGVTYGTWRVYARWVYLKCEVSGRLELLAKMR